MSKDLVQPTEGNTGYLSVVLLNNLLAEIQGLRRDIKKLAKPPAKAKTKKK
jgi:hypothetical protein